MKNERGITVIALVITIIVLLVLAAVAIGAVRDSDVIGHAQNAADRYSAGQTAEESMLGKYEDIISEYYFSNGNVGTDGEEINLADYYWYEENSEGGITILGPKKVRYCDDDKIYDQTDEILKKEFGEEAFNAYDDKLDMDEELRDQMYDRKMELYNEIISNINNEEIWQIIEVTRDQVGKENFIDENDFDGSVVIYEFNKPLPSYIDGKPVTTIGKSAFQEIYVINGEFIPNTVKVIEEKAFRNSLFYSQLVIPDSVIEIKDEAFRRLEAAEDEEGNDETTTLIMNDAKNNLKVIGYAAFEDSSLVGTLNLRREIEIANNAFEYNDVTINYK